MKPVEILLIGGLTVVAAAVGTVTGFGTSTVMVPVLTLFYPLPVTLLLVGIIHFFGDIWKVVLFKKGIKWRLILLFGIPGVVASLAGASLVFAVPQATLSRILGAVLAAYPVFIFVNHKFKLPQNVGSSLTGGALSGFLAGIFGVGGPVRGAFLAAFNLDKVVYIATSGAIGILVDLTRLTRYAAGGIGLPRALTLGLLVFIPASFLGAVIAEKVVTKIPQKLFRKIVAIFLLLVGIKLLIV